MTVDLILWRAMVAAAQQGAAPRRSSGWQAGLGRVLRALQRAVLGRRDG